MSETIELFYPYLAPEKQEVIVTASDAFALWTGCKRAACRRVGACRGFSGEPVPHCVPRLIAYFRVCLDAIGALLPERRPRTPGRTQEAAETMQRVQARFIAAIERRLDEIERQDARAAARRVE